MPAEGDKLPAGEVPQWRTRVQYAVDPDTGKAACAATARTRSSRSSTA